MSAFRLEDSSTTTHKIPSLSSPDLFLMPMPLVNQSLAALCTALLSSTARALASAKFSCEVARGEAPLFDNHWFAGGKRWEILDAPESRSVSSRFCLRLLLPDTCLFVHTPFMLSNHQQIFEYCVWPNFESFLMSIHPHKQNYGVPHGGWPEPL